MVINQSVTTPYGTGHVNGADKDGIQVRVTISDENREYLAQSLTPRATISAIWVFEKGELK